MGLSPSLCQRAAVHLAPTGRGDGQKPQFLCSEVKTAADISLSAVYSVGTAGTISGQECSLLYNTNIHLS